MRCVMNKTKTSLVAMAAVAMLLGACGKTESAPPTMPYADGEAPRKLPKGELLPLPKEVKPSTPAPKTIPKLKD